MGFSGLMKNLQHAPGQSMAVAWGADEGVLQACFAAVKKGLLREVFVTGPPEEIKSIAAGGNVNLHAFTLIPASSPAEGAALAVHLVKEGRCSILMKGNLNTNIILRAVLNKEQGIRAQALLSHIAVVQLPGPRLALLTDAAMNIRPDLGAKVEILNNAIQFAWSIGLTNPKTAVLAAVESVNPQMPETVDAAALTLMGRRGQFARPAVVDGPLAFDNAYSPEAAKQKKIDSPVAGRPDIFMVPELVSGNILYKAFSYVGFLPTSGLIYGASCPIVLVSRADTMESKLNGIAIACQALKE
ncbi:MAG TPA: bifunctional enoyl-CoA hydratase/phosphate acetyltransferase [Firmicutes bacterium]|nr:bifunctional enoyl-CoA hydratase/phosphate acetyltransferase [Bacillota bacterium]